MVFMDVRDWKESGGNTSSALLERNLKREIFLC